MITRAVDDAELVNETTALALRLASSATGALGHARRLLWSSFDSGLETQMEAEARSVADLARTEHFREGVAAFLGKRKPHFATPS